VPNDTRIEIRALQSPIGGYCADVILLSGGKPALILHTTRAYETATEAGAAALAWLNDYETRPDITISNGD
jgi:hypothetical protein